ncbi:MAG: hypothetical protein GX606_05965 [Elusimicrobia bacterium]|nr:hypothetical protein [Elusimicrobiota bacterium]
MGRILMGVFLLMILSLGQMPVAQAAYPSEELAILKRADISALSDGRLIDNYIDVLVEMEAVKTFHSTNNFTPKEYLRFKELLKYRLELLFEIHRRKMEIPPELN